MRPASSIVAGLAAILILGTPAALAQSPPNRVGAPPTKGLPAQATDLAQAPKARAPVARPPRPRVQSEQAHKDRINAWTVGLAAGRLEGAPLQFAAELARVLDDGDNMRVLPIVTRGPFDNVYDLLYLRGVDAAIVYGDVLDHFKSKPEFANAWRRINYLVNLFPSEAHVFVRPEIKSIKDLAGKVVNFNTEGTAAAYSGPIIFKQLGIEVKATFVPHNIAMEKMKTGPEVAATFWISSKPLAPFLKGKFPEGFKFLPIEYTDKLEYYAPAYLEHADYPGSDPARSADRHHLGAGRARRLRLAQEHRPLPAARPRRRVSLRALREAAEGARLPREVERREPRRQRAGLDALQASAGQARQGRSRIRAQRRSGAAARAGGARGAARSGRAGAPVPAVPRMEQEAEQAMTAH